MDDASNRIAGLSPEKRALLLKRLHQRRADASRQTAIPRRGTLDSYPLSFAQQRMWFLNQWEPDSPFYNISSAVRLPGSLDIPVLERSFNEIIRRHEVLRSRFVTVNGLPVQQVEPELILSIPFIDLENLSQDDQEKRIQHLATIEAQKPFDISTAPLIRICLLKLTPTEHVLLLTMHHIVSDGGSLGIFIHEVIAIYTAFLTGQPSPLSELPIQYADFADWQRNWFQGDALVAQLDYWKKQLEGAPPSLDIPLDRTRPAVQTFKGAHQNFSLSPAVSAGLKAISQSAEATMFMTLMAAFQVLLYRYSGQEDFCVGTPIANRTRPELAGLIGLFVNTLVIRADLSNDPTFKDYLLRVRETCLEAFTHLDLPLERLVDELKITRDLSRTPLFQVMFTLQETPAGLSGFDLDLQTSSNNNTAGDSVGKGGISYIDSDSGTSKFDLTLFVEIGPHGLTGGLEYNTDLFETGTIARMIHHFQTLLEGIITSPDQTISRLPLLKEVEKQQLLVEWNRTTTNYLSERTLAESFVYQVEQSPDAVAIIAGQMVDLPGNLHPATLPNNAYTTVQITYGELNRRANQLAHYLQTWGVGPEVLVGVYLERSLEMAVATLAIIKAGGAYLPLDLGYPKERLAFMIQESQSPVILTVSELLPNLPDWNSASTAFPHIICLDQEAEVIASQNITNPSCAATTENLAYLIYTSGSTGIPKGVPIIQRSINRLIYNTNYLNYGSISRMAHLSNPSFDAATAEIWGALLNGVILVVIPRDITLSSHAFADFIRDQRISDLFITSALFNHIINEVPDAFSQVDTLMFGGESADVKSVRQVLQSGAPQRLINVYGPTECTTFSTWYLIQDLPEQANSVSIGRAISNTQTYVLDRHFQPCPIGVPGELYLGGDGLARGYFKRPELTAERFIKNPHADLLRQALQADNLPLPHDERIYKTGDLVRWLPDGNIEFLGRIDTQVKIRGLRIELGEIEIILGRYPAVQETIVIAREDSPGDKRLVAYIVPKPGARLNITELRRYLKEKLPEFMVPSAFITLDSIPLTPNGKVNRHALPVPDSARPELEKAYVAPRTVIEKYIVEKWQAALGLENIGIYDNFFELGGDSLKAAVLMNRLQEELGVVTHVRALFMAPTVSDLALYMGEYYPGATKKIIEIMRWDDRSEAEGSGVETETGRQVSILDQAGGQFTFQQELNAVNPQRVNAARLAQIRQLIRPLTPRSPAQETAVDKNPPAIFVLSPPRSGSTLLRTMLAGNPDLFSPPELDLLSFNTLSERRDTFSGPYQFWLEGVIRAIMEVKGCEVNQAEQLMRGFEEQGMSVKTFYRQLQTWIGDKLLVDKTPVYALDLEILKRAEEDFNQPFYIHLMRHPYASIYSFIEAKLDQVFFRYPHPFTQRELAELVWIVSHQNILEFLETIPAKRQLRVAFEEMVHQPEVVMRRLSAFLGIEFTPDMLKPYEGKKMTSGVRPGAQMVGDFKFYLRQNIDANAADRWKHFQVEDFLSDTGWEVAQVLGYEKVVKDSERSLRTGVEQSTSLPGGQQESEISDKKSITQVGSVDLLAPIPRLDRQAFSGTELPLSYAQQRLWFLDQWEPGSPYYNIPSAIRLKGRLNAAALERSLNEIVRRHEVLRTVFISVDGKPGIRIEPHWIIPLPIVDLQSLPMHEQESEARRLAEAEARQPFDLSRGPLLRARLVRLGREDHIFLLTFHHIISDGWSVGVFNRELAALYPAFAEGKPSPLQELPLQYADFAAWQRTWLEGQILNQQMDYWKNKLAGCTQLLELPTDRPRPSVQTLHGSRQLFEIPADLSERIRSLSRQERATLFMTLLAAFYVLLYRYSGQEDINIGTPIANRTRREIEGLIGFFVNTLVLRGNLSGSQTFRNFLGQIKQTSVEAYEHQDLPFEQLVDKLHPEREMSHTPLFQAMFTLQEAPVQSIHTPGLVLQPIHTESGTAKFDLILTLVERGDMLKGVMEFNSDLFDPETIARILNHYQALLAGIVANPAESISQLPLMSIQEHQALLTWSTAEWEEIDKGLFSTTIHALFAEQAQKTPERLAVYYEGQGLSFRELDLRSNQVAHRLRKLGVQAEELVGLYLERSVEMLVGLLGILKAGGAYLPLDPSYPDDRLRFILQDAQVKIILTQEKLQARLIGPAFSQGLASEGSELLIRSEPLLTHPTVQTVILDRDWSDEFAQDSDTIPVEITTPAGLAYVIYTSGSTGKPKGVMIEHRTALNLWQGLASAVYADLPGSEEGLKLSLNAPLLFDASVQQWLMLLSGYSLYIVPQELRGDGEGLLTYIRKHHLDSVDCVPSQLKLLLEAGLLAVEGWVPSVMLPGGEAIDQFTWERLAKAERTEFYNMYGPTECTVDSTICRAKEYGLKVSIGRPVINTRCYVVDRWGQLVPVGVPGELWIAGAGVGRGYLNRKELTADKFITDPFIGAGMDAEGQSLRLYKTGDLVRYLPDGYLEYLGRVDDQVKLRGFRIELGEIETTLTQHPEVRDAVVIVREDTPGEKQLVAYLVVEQSRTPEDQSTVKEARLSVSDFRTFLKSKLPEYMIPAMFVQLLAIPRTPNGKLDRRSLPKPESKLFQAGRLEVEGEYQAPQTPEEVLLAQIWADVLGVERVGIRDNFFELGGDSIMSIQVIARAKKVGLPLAPRQMFEAQTIEELARLVGQVPFAQAEQAIVTGDVPLTPIQRHFFELNLKDPQHWNQAILLSVIPAETGVSGSILNPDWLRQSVHEILNHHDALRMRFSRLDSSNWRQFNAGSEALEFEQTPFEWLDLSGLSEIQQILELQAKIDQVQAGLNLQNGPLFRVVYFHLGSHQPARLLLVAHHLVIDGVSWRILLEDLQTTYWQLSLGEPVRLPAKTTSYKYWAEQLILFSQSPSGQADQEYWSKIDQLSVPELTLDLHDKETLEAENLESSLEGVRASLEVEDTRKLLQQVPVVYHTEINDILLTALVITLGRWSGHPQVKLYLEGHGREPLDGLGNNTVDYDVDVSRTVGWFTSLYPVFLSLERLPSENELGQALKAVKEQLRQIPQRGFGYGLLRLTTESIPKRNLPQISFNYLGQVDTALPEMAVAGHLSRQPLIENEGAGITQWSFKPATESVGMVHSPQDRRENILDISVSVTQGQLRMEWQFSQNLHRRENIEKLVQDYIHTLQAIIQFCLSQEAGGYTPSDFPDIQLDQDGLDKLLEEIGGDNIN